MKQKIICLTTACFIALPQLLQAQNVGIGTLTPASALDVRGHGRSGILGTTDSVAGPAFTYAQYNNAPAGIRGEYRTTGLNHGSGVVGTALSATAGYGNGITGKGGFTGVYGMGSNGGLAGVYAAADSATWGLYVDGNSRFKGKIGISSSANFVPVKALDVDGDANIGYSLKVGSTLDVVEDATIGGSLKIQGGLPGPGKTLTSDAVGNASWQESAPRNASFYTTIDENSNLFVVSASSNDYDTLQFIDNASGGYHFDNGSNFNNTTHIFTAPSEGFYTFSFLIYLTAGSIPTSDGVISVQISGVTPYLKYWQESVTAGQPIPRTVSGTINAKLFTGAKVKLSIVQTTGLSTVQISPNLSFFSGYKIY